MEFGLKLIIGLTCLCVLVIISIGINALELNKKNKVVRYTENAVMVMFLLSLMIGLCYSLGSLTILILDTLFDIQLST